MLFKKDNMPKGTLIIIGGAEEREEKEELKDAYRNKSYEKFEVLKTFLSILKTNANILVVVTASTVPDELGETYIKVFKDLGHINISIINLIERGQANSKIIIEKLKKAKGVFFAGGDQFRLSTILGGTEFMDELKERYKEDKDFVIAGTSAGAMALPYTTVYGDNRYEALLKGQVKIIAGLGLIDNCIIDTHFIKRGRFFRLVHAIIVTPTSIGIGLGENTALIIKNGYLMQCIGSGMVIIIDVSKVTHTNVALINEDEPINIENLIVHIVKKGDVFDLSTRALVPYEKIMNN